MANLDNARPRRRWLRWILRYVEHTLALVGLGTLVYCACFDLSRITSGSMGPTLRGEDFRSGDLVLTERVSYWLRKPRRWEVVSFRTDEGVPVMKRVVGMPDEVVQMRRDGQIVINGHLCPRPAQLDFLSYFPYGNLVVNNMVDCLQGYYLLGDHSRDSDDSRFTGPVPRERITGRAWLILAPAAHRGFVKQ
jgi:signal peptidase I